MTFLTTLKEDEFEAWMTWWPMFMHWHQKPPSGDWTTWLMLGGRGAGKTRAGAEWVKQFAESSKGKQGPIALVGETEHDVREVMVRREQRHRPRGEGVAAAGWRGG